ncbi:MAG: HAD family phosphatase [Candidatus Woesearchaeota archaeon]|nr:HAD family phosphatase [Candidatus Woesearchaeota archaeon]
MIFIFDMFGVVVKWSSVVVSRWCAYAHASDPEFRSSTKPDFELCETGKISMQELWARIGKRYNVSPSELERIFINCFDEIARLDDAVVDIIKPLPVSMLSNQFPLHFELCRKKGWHDFFNNVFVSFEIGFMKPDPRAYRAVVEKLQVAPSDIVFVDDKEENVEAAKKAGMHGIVFKDAVQLKSALSKFYKFH